MDSAHVCGKEHSAHVCGKVQFQMNWKIGITGKHTYVRTAQSASETSLNFGEYNVEISIIFLDTEEQGPK